MASTTARDTEVPSFPRGDIDLERAFVSDEPWAHQSAVGTCQMALGSSMRSMYMSFCLESRNKYIYDGNCELQGTFPIRRAHQ
jgi:hypothetical protein